MLTRLMRRSTVFRRQGWLAFVIATAMALLFTVAGAFVATPQQQVQRDYGVYDSILSADTVLPGHAAPDLCREEIIPTGATTCGQLLFYQASFQEVGEITVLEQDHQAFPDAYVLLSGRWPSRPGEVVTTADLPSGEPLSAAGGALRLMPVGRFKEVFDNEAMDVLAAPGTWAAVSGSIDSDAFPALTASLEYGWSGAPVEAVTQALSHRGIESAVRSASDIGPRDVTAALGLFGQIPLVLLPLMSGLLAAAWTSRWRRATAGQLWRIGISRSSSRRAMFAAGLIRVSTGTAGGLAVGWTVAVLSRPLLAGMITAPLAPVELAWQPFLITTAGLALGYLIGMTEVPTHSSLARIPGLARAVPMARRVLAVGLGAALIAKLVTTSGPEDVTVTIILAVVLATVVTPDIVRALTMASWKSPATRLGAAMLRRHPRHGALMAAALVAMLSFSGASTAAMTTFVAMDNAATPDTLPAGMVALGEAGGYDLPEGIDARFEAYTGLSHPVAVTRYDVDQEGFPGILVSLNSVADVERLLGTQLPQKTAEGLQRGALLVRQGGLGGIRSSEDEPYEAPDEVVLDYPMSLSMGAIVLTHWAEQRGWRALDVGFYYPQATAEQQARTRTAAAALGIEDSFVSWSRQADQTAMSTVQAWAIVALGVGLLCLVSMLAAAQGRELRPYLSRLRAIGLPGSWTRRVVLVQLGLVVGVAVMLAATVTAVTVLGLVIVNGAPPVVPWQALVALGFSMVCGLGGGVLLGTLGLRSAERLAEG